MKVSLSPYLTKLDLNLFDNKFRLIVHPGFFSSYLKEPLFRLVLILLAILSFSPVDIFSGLALYLVFEWSRVLIHEIGHAVGFVFLTKSDWIEIELRTGGGGSTESKFNDREISNFKLIMLCLLGPTFDLIFSLILSLNLLIFYGQAAISIVALMISIYTFGVNLIPGWSDSSDGSLIFKTLKQSWVVSHERTLQLFWGKDCN